jgi:hypothetical protein
MAHQQLYTDSLLFLPSLQGIPKADANWCVSRCHHRIGPSGPTSSFDDCTQQCAAGVAQQANEPFVQAGGLRFLAPADPINPQNPVQKASGTVSCDGISTAADLAAGECAGRNMQVRSFKGKCDNEKWPVAGSVDFVCKPWPKPTPPGPPKPPAPPAKE